MKKFFLTALVCAGCMASVAQKNTVLNSPDGSIKVELTKKPLGWTVTQNGKKMYTLQDVSMQIGTSELACANAYKNVKTVKKSETIRPAVSMKYNEVKSEYTEATLAYGNYDVQLRVFNNAVAYRFVTRMKGDVEVKEDRFTLVPEAGYAVHRQPCGSFNTSYEEEYRHQSMEQWKADDRRLSTVPCLLSAADDKQLLIGEADVDDYPRLFLTPNDKGITPTYPKSPITWEPNGDRGLRITKESDYIAKTKGQRTFPWRYVVCTDSKGIIEQTLTLQLSRKSVLTDTSWIKPGTVSWEWWNGAAPYGEDVDFEAGCNYETYAYFADFASKYGINYILLDEGWAKDTRDPFTERPGMRLQELIKYCKSKGVGVILWLPWLTVEQHMDLFQEYAKWGIAGVKIDFMDHADQWMVNYYKRVAQEAAKHKLLVDFHGAFTPAGLEYEYPNLISYEGVRGLEQMGGCRPDNTAYIPFIRNAVGAADFTPGAMFNMQPDRYRADRPNSGAMGTRCFQMALSVVLESGVQMLADNPTLYYQNDACTRYIASVPTTWDETRCLAAEVGKYIVVAKRKGQKWFIAGLCNGEKDQRTITVNLDFLGSGQHNMTSFSDGVNANWQAMHYKKQQTSVSKSTRLEIKMKKNGGFAAVVE